MLAAGLRQRQVALRLGISQPTVSAYKRDLVDAGRLPTQGKPTSDGPVELGEPPALRASRPRAEILLEAATIKASMLRTVTRTLLEQVVRADEWVTDPGFPGAVRSAAADDVGEAVDHLAEIAAALKLRPVVGAVVGQEAPDGEPSGRQGTAGLGRLAGGHR